MILSIAIQRVKDGLGFRTGTVLDARITLRFQEAQRDLERGKTLPFFLKREDQTLTLLSGTSRVTIPADFLREDDSNPLHYTPTGTNKPFFLKRVNVYRDAVEGNIKAVSVPTGPKVYVSRLTFLDFITTADRTYTLTWTYYRAAELLTSDIQNLWLASAPEWLIGEAGLRMAADLRDTNGLAIFTKMRDVGRADCFAETVAAEEAGAAYEMGADQ